MPLFHRKSKNTQARHLGANPVNQPGEMPKQAVVKKPNPVFHWIKETFFAKHHAIEHFGILFFILLFGISACLVRAEMFQHQYKTQISNSTALYTSSFTTSKSHVTASIPAVYVNKARTKCFLLMHFSSVHSVPLEPTLYQFFMCGEDGHGNYARIQGSPAGAFYIFGGTGYMGMYLVNRNGFKPQVLNLVGRINAKLVKNFTTDDTGNNAFRKYDQFRIRFNPGAKDVTYLPALDAKGIPAVASLYRSMVLAKQERDAKKDLAEDLQDMQIDLNKIQDYKERLATYDKVKAPDGPGYIRGDKIVTKNFDGKKQLFLETKHVMSGGYNITWQRGNIENTDYAGQAMRQAKVNPNMNILDFISKQAAKREDVDDDNSDTSSSYYSSNVPDREWKYLNGKRVHVDLNNTGSTSATKVSRAAQMNDDIQNLEDAWDNYISDKQDYQGSTQARLLTYQHTYREIAKFTAVNSSPSILTLY